MRVERIVPGSLAPTARKAAATEFPEWLEPPVGQAAPAASAADIAALNADAAVGEELADRQARRHGRAMLEALAALQLAILGGGEAVARAALADLAAAAPAAHDPVLRLILREISLRAAVELARPARSTYVSTS